MSSENHETPTDDLRVRWLGQLRNDWRWRGVAMAVWGAVMCLILNGTPTQLVFLAVAWGWLWLIPGWVWMSCGRQFAAVERTLREQLGRVSEKHDRLARCCAELERELESRKSGATSAQAESKRTANRTRAPEERNSILETELYAEVTQLRADIWELRRALWVAEERAREAEGRTWDAEASARQATKRVADLERHLEWVMETGRREFRQKEEEVGMAREQGQREGAEYAYRLVCEQYGIPHQGGVSGVAHFPVAVDTPLAPPEALVAGPVEGQGEPAAPMELAASTEPTAPAFWAAPATSAEPRGCAAPVTPVQPRTTASPPRAPQCVDPNPAVPRELVMGEAPQKAAPVGSKRPREVAPAPAPPALVVTKVGGRSVLQLPAKAMQMGNPRPMTGRWAKRH